VLEHADEILVLADGRVVERGTHASLLAQNGLYAETHRTRRPPVADTPPLGTFAALRRFWPYVRAHRRWLWLGLAMIPVVAAVSALRPLLIKQAIDVDIAAGDAVGLRFTAMLFLGAVMAEFFASAIQVYALQRVGLVTINDLRRSIFRHVLRLPARFYDKTPIGSLLSRSTSDVEALSETLAFGVFTILTDIAVILSIVAAMFVLDARLTLISLAVAPVLTVIVGYFSGKLRGLQLEIRKAQSVQSGYLAEQLAGTTVVQLYGREPATVRSTSASASGSCARSSWPTGTTPRCSRSWTASRRCASPC
jgi:ATP-binding cassette subfamily B multidrug efflux pump